MQDYKLLCSLRLSLSLSLSNNLRLPPNSFVFVSFPLSLSLSLSLQARLSDSPRFHFKLWAWCLRNPGSHNEGQRAVVQHLLLCPWWRRLSLPLWLRKPLLLGGPRWSSAAEPEQPSYLSIRPLCRANLRHLLHCPSQTQPSQVLSFCQFYAFFFSLVRCLIKFIDNFFFPFLMDSWLYRVKPSVTHEPFKPRVPSNGKILSEFNQSNSATTPTQLRWKPMDIPDSPVNFVDGLYTVCGAGSSFLRHGYAIHM